MEPDQNINNDLLWCEECGISHKTECRKYGELKKIADAVIPSKAKLTVPPILRLKLVSYNNRGQEEYGIFPKRVIQTRTQFGPVLAEEINDDDICARRENRIFKMKVFKSDGETLMLSREDEDRCNWMMLVRPAETPEQQNLVAYQHQERIYFTTFKPIPPGAELRVWYADPYADMMGVFHPVRNPAALLQSPTPDTVEENDTKGANVKDLKADFGLSEHMSDDEGPEMAAFEQSCKGDIEWACSCCKQTFVTFEKLESHHCKTPDASAEESKRKGRPKRHLIGDKAKGVKTRVRETLSKKSKTTRGSRSVGGKKLNNPLLVCAVCLHAFMNKRLLAEHMFTHTAEDKPYQCTVENCNKSFASKFKFQRHSLIHTAPRSHVCVICHKSFNRKDHLKNHMTTHNPDKRRWTCFECDKSYGSNFNYRIHMCGHDALEKGETVCIICKKDLGDKDKLIFHLKVHTGSRIARGLTVDDRKVPCPHCSKRFFTNKDMKRHVIVHTKERDHLCHHCSQRFGRADHLSRHFKTHHNPDAVMQRKLQRKPRQPKQAAGPKHLPSVVSDLSQRQVILSSNDDHITPMYINTLADGLSLIPNDRIQLISGERFMMTANHPAQMLDQRQSFMTDRGTSLVMHQGTPILSAQSDVQTNQSSINQVPTKQRSEPDSAVILSRDATDLDADASTHQTNGGRELSEHIQVLQVGHGMAPDARIIPVLHANRVPVCQQGDYVLERFAHSPMVSPDNQQLIMRQQAVNLQAYRPAFTESPNYSSLKNAAIPLEVMTHAAYVGHLSFVDESRNLLPADGRSSVPTANSPPPKTPTVSLTTSSAIPNSQEQLPHIPASSPLSYRDTITFLNSLPTQNIGANPLTEANEGETVDPRSFTLNIPIPGYQTHTAI